MLNKMTAAVQILAVFLCLFAPILTKDIPPAFQTRCVKGTYPPKGRAAVPSYTINLDLPPEQRWAQLAKDKSDGIKALLEILITLLKDFGSVGETLVNLVDDDMGYLVDTLPAPFGDELKGISTASGINLGEVVLFNVFYEIFTVCTSIVAEDSSGEMYHGRNLDFGLFLGWNVTDHSWETTAALRPLIVNLDFQRGGKTVYKAVNFAGYVGILTAVKPKLFTMSMDERFSIDGGFIGVLEWILGKRDARWMGFLTRATMENATSYSQAKDMLSNTPMMAPGYFILGGNTSGQGCIITRSRAKAEDVWDMGTRNSTWYLVETNYDNWKDPLFVDNRRGPAKECLNKLTKQNVGVAGIFDVLNSNPVLNKLTTYTAIMQVKTGHLETYLQYCDEPCAPW